MADAVPLPRTYRPLGARVAAAAGAVVLVGGLVLFWLLLSADVRARFTTFQRITLVLLFAAMLAVLHGLFRTKAVADDAGLTIVNGYKVRRFEWAQIVKLTLTPNRPWAILDLDDGATVSVMALQSADGARASRSARELAGVIAHRTRTDRDS